MSIFSHHWGLREELGGDICEGFFMFYQTNVYGMLSADTEERNWISGTKQIITGVFCK